jgi:hypothetical protein
MNVITLAKSIKLGRRWLVVTKILANIRFG